MQIRVLTRHSEDFDILTHPVDPGRSTYAINDGYPEKVRAFLEKIGIESALWACPEDQPLKYVEIGKECEYVLEVNVSRIAAYVDESTWSPYINGVRQDFVYSLEPQQYGLMSLIIPTPIEPKECKWFRRFRSLNGPDKFEIVENREWKFQQSR